MQVKQFVVLVLEDQKYCIPIEYVNGIISDATITLVPGATSHIRGVSDIRGDIIPVVSLKKLFNIEKHEKEEDKLLNVKILGKSIGFLVDSASQVVNVESKYISKMPAIALSGGSRYLESVALIEGEAIIVINPEKLFTEEEKQELFELKKTD